MNRVALTLLFLALSTAPTAWGQETPLADDPRVESALGLPEAWMDAERAYKQIPGASVAVVHDQDLVWSRGFGFSNRETAIPATPQTIYSICSISKLFTSIGVMQLRDRGLVSLGDSPDRHLP